MTAGSGADTGADAARPSPSAAMQPLAAVPATACDPRIAALRDRGADRADPVRFRYIEALARRSAAYGGETRALLDRKLADALAAFAARHGETGPVCGAGSVSKEDAAHPPGRAQRPPVGPLGQLVSHIERHGPAPAPGDRADVDDSASPPELKSLQRDRAAWARLGIERQLARALASAPENPGPLNSHALALRALRLMQDLSPAYLARFLAQVDTLLWLEHTGAAGPQPHGPAGPADGSSNRHGKRKPARGQPR